MSSWLPLNWSTILSLLDLDDDFIYFYTSSQILFSPAPCITFSSSFPQPIAVSGAPFHHHCCPFVMHYEFSPLTDCNVTLIYLQCPFNPNNKLRLIPHERWWINLRTKTSNNKNTGCAGLLTRLPIIIPTSRSHFPPCSHCHCPTYLTYTSGCQPNALVKTVAKGAHGSSAIVAFHSN